MLMMTFQTRLKNPRKPTQSRIRFDLKKLNDPTVMSAFQATIGGRFAPLATLVDKDADLDSMVTHFNKAVTDTAAELLGKQRRKRKPWVTPEILDLCDQRRDLKKRRGEPEEAKEDEEHHPILREEVEAAVNGLKMGKLSGLDNIPAELVQAGGEAMIDILTAICKKIWKTGEWPTTWTIPSYHTPKERQLAVLLEL